VSAVDPGGIARGEQSARDVAVGAGPSAVVAETVGLLGDGAVARFDDAVEGCSGWTLRRWSGMAKRGRSVLGGQVTVFRHSMLSGRWRGGAVTGR